MTFHNHGTFTNPDLSKNSTGAKDGNLQSVVLACDLGSPVEILAYEPTNSRVPINYLFVIYCRTRNIIAASHARVMKCRLANAGPVAQARSPEQPSSCYFFLLSPCFGRVGLCRHLRRHLCSYLALYMSYLARWNCSSQSPMKVPREGN